jgi:hypothetical protein
MYSRICKKVNNSFTLCGCEKQKVSDVRCQMSGVRCQEEPVLDV